MASVVCQGLQSCLEPQLTESSFLTHKMSSKATTQLHKKPIAEANSVIDNNGEKANKKNGFSFFDVLKNNSSNCIKNEEVYVHPMVKRSSSGLSRMSLEMCTESLGTETGSESSDEFNWEERDRFVGLQRSKADQNSHRKVVSHRRGGGFPPPLTSISGSDGTVKVRPHRENGRLVIKAVSVSDCGTKFETERSNGRLRLSLLKECSVKVEKIEEKSDGNRRKTGKGASTRLPKLKSLRDSTEFRLSSCKDNKTFGNWCLFRVVIS